MKHRILALALALLLLVSALPAASATGTVPCLTVDSSLVIIGDSNTVYLKKNNPDIQPARIYARVNATIVECVKNYSRYHADGYDKGLYQLITALNGSSFRTVVINIGTNNAGTPTESFKSDYRSLLNILYAKNPNAVIYLCKILPINPSHYSGPYPDVFTHANIARINNAVAELQAEYAAQGYDARIMDLNTPFKNAAGNLMPEYDLGGGIHLTTVGYKRLNQVVQTALAQGDPGAAHNWGSAVTVKAPTCAEQGLASFSCSVCGAKKTEALPKTNQHVWDAGVVVRAATCTQAGTRRSTCAVCGSATKDTAIPALGHVWTLSKLLTLPESLHAGTGVYVCSRCGKTKQDRLCAAVVFTDMPPEEHWAHDPIDWALFKGVTAGKGEGTFAPNDTITRAEAMTFLWISLGRPEPEATENPFADVTEEKYFYKPVLWAMEHEVTSGVSESAFGAGEFCTRGQIVTFLWVAAGKPEPKRSDSPFSDVSEEQYFYKPVLWAVENYITGGTSETTFSPNESCTRAQVVTFLYKAVAIIHTAQTAS